MLLPAATVTSAARIVTPAPPVPAAVFVAWQTMLELPRTATAPVTVSSLPPPTSSSPASSTVMAAKLRVVPATYRKYS